MVVFLCAGPWARLWEAPTNLVGDLERIALWTRVMTGRTLDEDNVIHEFEFSQILYDKF